MGSNVLPLKSASSLKKRLKPSHFVIGRIPDFWLLGGASIAFWLVMVVSHFWKDSSPVVYHQFENLAVVFGTLSIVVNYPHFMLSYKFGYGRGFGFVLKNWISLILVPVAMISIFTLAFLSLDRTIAAPTWSVPLNVLLQKVRIPFQFGHLTFPGIEILSLSILAMFFSVGWHYSKQVFGCMMVYAKYDEYPVNLGQRKLLVFHLYTLAAVNIIFRYLEPQYAPRLFDAPLIFPQLASGVFSLAFGLFWLSLILVSFSLVYENYKKKSVLPSLNMVIPWAAFVIWSMPMLQIGEYTRVAIPFFHSLQYLPFAVRLDGRTNPDPKGQFKSGLSILLLLGIGFLCFEGIPSSLDQAFATKAHFNIQFFLIAATVFINIHHYFIDSVTWKFADPEVRNKLLYTKD